MWLSLVERCVRDAEVAGSNPVIPTNFIFRITTDFSTVMRNFYVLYLLKNTHSNVKKHIKKLSNKPHIFV